MAMSHKTCMEQAEIIDTFGTYQQYDGPEDSTRCSAEELTADGILTRIQHLTKCASISEMGFVRPYASDRALPQVRVFKSLL